MSTPHGHPLALDHCKTSRWPFLAAYAQVRQSHGHPFVRDHCNRDVDSTALLIVVVVVHIVLYTRENRWEVNATNRKWPRPRNWKISPIRSSEKSEIPTSLALVFI